jgi:hypothetical protein
MGEHADGSLAGKDAKMGWGQYRPRWGHDVSDAHVASRQADELTGAELATDRDAPAVVVNLGLLNHAHGIGPPRNRRASHDARSFTLAHLSTEDMAGHDGADDREANGSIMGVGRADRVAVHGGVRERGNRLGRHNGFADDAVQGFVERERSRLQGEALADYELLGLLEWDHGRGPAKERMPP